MAIRQPAYPLAFVLAVWRFITSPWVRVFRFVVDSPILSGIAVLILVASMLAGFAYFGINVMGWPNSLVTVGTVLLGILALFARGRSRY